MIRFVLIALLVAVAVYLLVRLLERRHSGRPAPTRDPGRRTVAPDDDEQFLRDLNRRKREEEPPGS